MGGAHLRFRHAFTNCRHRAVFTSFAWDIYRRTDHFANTSRTTWLDAFAKNFSTVLRAVSSLIDTVVDVPFRMDYENDDVIEAIRDSARRANAKILDSFTLGFPPKLHQTRNESQRWWQTFLPVLK